MFVRRVVVFAAPVVRSARAARTASAVCGPVAGAAAAPAPADSGPAGLSAAPTGDAGTMSVAHKAARAAGRKALADRDGTKRTVITSEVFCPEPEPASGDSDRHCPSTRRPGDVGPLTSRCGDAGRRAPPRPGYLPACVCFGSEQAGRQAGRQTGRPGGRPPRRRCRRWGWCGPAGRAGPDLPTAAGASAPDPAALPRRPSQLCEDGFQQPRVRSAPGVGRHRRQRPCRRTARAARSARAKSGGRLLSSSAYRADSTTRT